MNCHGGGNKRPWVIALVIAMLAIGLWAAFGKGGLVGLLPFAGIILCPIIHGALFIFLGKSMMCSKHEQTASKLNESN